MRHPRIHAWQVAAGIVAGGAALAGIRTAAGRPVLSAPTLAAAGAGTVAGGIMIYEWLTPRSWLYGPVFWHGPCHPYTEQLLEILAREVVRATFFQIGNNVRREPNLAAEVASRNVVANHTYDHPHLVWSRPSTIREQLQRGQEAIHDATGTLPHLFRVQHGRYGPQVISTAEELGFRCVGWSVMAWDWDRPPSDVIERRILHGLRPGGVSLLHDGQDTDAFPKADRSHTVAAVPHIIHTLKANGFGFVTLPELMDLDARDSRP